MSNNLTKQVIKDSFRKLLQIGPDKKIYNGTGSLVRDMIIDGSLTASSDISASGTIFANKFQSNGSSDSIQFNDDLQVSGKAAITGSLTGLGDTILGNAGTDKHTITGDITASGAISCSGFVYARQFLTSSVAGTLPVLGSITASSDISASGNIFGSSLTIGGASTPNRLTDIVSYGGITGSQAITASGNIYGNSIQVGYAGTTPGSKTKTAILAYGGITGSNDISASGNIISARVKPKDFIESADDEDTQIDFRQTDEMKFWVGGEPLLTLTEDSQDVVIIGDGGDVDFQVKSLDDDNIIFVQGSSDLVGIGTNAPVRKLNVKGDISGSGDLTITGKVVHTGSLVTKNSITASNDISASGNLYGNSVTVKDTLSTNYLVASGSGPISQSGIHSSSLFVPPYSRTGTFGARNYTGDKGGIYFEGDATSSRMFWNGVSKLTVSSSNDLDLWAVDDINIRSHGGNVRLYSSGSGDIELTSQDNIVLDARDDITITTGDGNGDDIKLFAGGNLILSASVGPTSGDTVIIGNGVTTPQIWPNRALEVKGNTIVTGSISVTGAITASSNVKVNGHIVGDNATNISGIHDITASGHIHVEEGFRARSQQLIGNSTLSPTGSGMTNYVSHATTGTSWDLPAASACDGCTYTIVTRVARTADFKIDSQATDGFRGFSTFMSGSGQAGTSGGRSYVSSSIIKGRYLVYDESNGHGGNGNIGDKAVLTSDGTYWYVDATAYGNKVTANQQPVWSGSSS